jgi:transcriptional regulator with XRE-family HTH domain
MSYNKLMKVAEREMAVRLRLEKKLGYGEIAKRVGVSKSTLSRWLEDLPLSDFRIRELRTKAWGKGEAKRERFRQSMRKKRAAREQRVYEAAREELQAPAEQALYIAGLMLYAAEGDKKTRYEIAFANTDYVMVRFFADWLVQFLGVDRARLKIQLHMYENRDVRKEERFWLRALGFKKSQLCKTQVKSVPKGKYSYPEPFRHGSCKLYIGGGQIKERLMLSIKAFFDTYEERTRSSVGRASA